MKKVICLVASVAFLVNANAQNTVRKNFGSFNAIEVSSAAKVKLIPSDSNYVELSSKDPIKKEPAMEVQEGVLKISTPFKGKIEVYAKNINSIKVTDAGRVTCKDTFNLDNLTIKVTDAGTANVLVHAKTIKAQADDAGSITFSGSAVSIDAQADDAGNINSSDLRVANVKAISSNGAKISVHADSSINANSSGGSSISVTGNPKQKSMSASGGGTVDSSKGKTLKVSADLFIGGGFVTGGSNGAGVKYGNSREFIVGFGKEYKPLKWDAIGWDIYYKSTDFYLVQNASSLYQSEKVSTQNFGGLIYDRIYIGKLFLDGGFYYDWAFHSKHITWEDANGITNKAKQTNMGYVNSTDYGLSFHVGVGDVSLYCNYRLSKLFQNTDASGQPYPTMPTYTIGIIFGL